MIYCENCKTELPDDAVACYRCGRATDAATYVRPLGTATERLPFAPTQKNSRAGLIFGIVAVGLLGAILVALVAIAGTYSYMRASGHDTANDSTRDMPTQTPVKQQPQREALPATPTTEPEKTSVKVVNETREVLAGKTWAIPFTLPTQGTTKGGFTVGGGNKDIDAYIVDAQNYSLLDGRQSFRSVISFNRAARGRLNTQLAPGSYFLVFSNRHALWYSKQVATEMDVIY